MISNILLKQWRVKTTRWQSVGTRPPELPDPWSIPASLAGPTSKWLHLHISIGVYTCMTQVTNQPNKQTNKHPTVHQIGIMHRIISISWPRLHTNNPKHNRTGYQVNQVFSIQSPAAQIKWHLVLCTGFPEFTFMFSWWLMLPSRLCYTSVLQGRFNSGRDTSSSSSSSICVVAKEKWAMDGKSVGFLTPPAGACEESEKGGATNTKIWWSWMGKLRYNYRYIPTFKKT